MVGQALIEKFEQFLIDNNIFSQFCSNIFVEYSMLLYEYCEYIRPFHYINEAFTWSHTEEGYDFWWEVDRKWYKIYEKNKLK